MARVRMPLLISLVAIALLLAAFLGATAASFPLWFRYRNAAGLGAARAVSQIAAGLAAVGLLATAAIVALPTALLPAGRWRKLLYVLPAYLLGFTLVGALLFALRIGTVGPFATAWLAGGALLSLIAAGVAIARAPLGDRVARRAMTAIGVTGGLGGLAWLGTLIAIVIVLTSTPSAGQGGREAPAGAAPAPNGQPRPAQPGGGFPGGPGGEGFPGGPGGPAGSPTPLLVGGALMTLFGVVAGASIARGLRASRALASAPGAARVVPAQIDYRHEAGRALFSCLAITIVGLAAAQLVPVRRDNPPAQTAVRWDSPQTQELARRACMDCHSNETRWPWYAAVAPGSWLLRSHVSEGREHLNLSALNNLPAFRAAQLHNDVAQQIRSGSMPPADYLILHPEARLSAAEKQQLTQGLQQSLASSLPK